MDAENPFPAERTAVITGAASARGIGRATADRLARDGWSIAILDLDEEGAKRTAAKIGAPIFSSMDALSIRFECLGHARASPRPLQDPVAATICGVTGAKELPTVEPRRQS